jgi:hypothetical protein
MAAGPTSAGSQCRWCEHWCLHCAMRCMTGTIYFGASVDLQASPLALPCCQAGCEDWPSAITHKTQQQPMAISWCRTPGKLCMLLPAAIDPPMRKCEYPSRVKSWHSRVHSLARHCTRTQHGTATKLVSSQVAGGQLCCCDCLHCKLCIECPEGWLDAAVGRCAGVWCHSKQARHPTHPRMPSLTRTHPPTHLS